MSDLFRAVLFIALEDNALNDILTYGPLGDVDSAPSPIHR
jgi:hypothetical protein